MRNKHLQITPFLLIFTILFISIIGTIVYFQLHTDTQLNPYFAKALQMNKDTGYPETLDLQNVGVNQESEGVNLRVEQTIGDNKSLYALIEVEFPKDEVDLEALLHDYSRKEVESSIFPKEIEVFVGEGLNDSLSSDQYSQNRQIPNCYELKLVDVDFTRNAAMYLLQYHTYLETLTNKKFAIVLNSFYIQDQNAKEEKCIWEGTLRAVWIVENKAEPIQISFGENEQGKINLSPIALEISFPSGEGVSLADFEETVQLLDNQKLPIKMPSNRQHFSSSSTFVEMFVPLLDIEQVRYIRIGDVILDMD